MITPSPPSWIHVYVVMKRIELVSSINWNYWNVSLNPHPINHAPVDKIMVVEMLTHVYMTPAMQKSNHERVTETCQQRLVLDHQSSDWRRQLPPDVELHLIEFLIRIAWLPMYQNHHHPCDLGVAFPQVL